MSVKDLEARVAELKADLRAMRESGQDQSSLAAYEALLDEAIDVADSLYKAKQSHIKVMRAIEE